MKRIEALNAVYDRLHDRIGVTIMGAVATELQVAAALPRTTSVSTLDAFTSAFDQALAAGDLTTIVAKVEAVGPSAYVTDQSLLENRFQFARSLRS
jgi:sulfopyruvate decarboxylase subunit beta